MLSASPTAGGGGVEVADSSAGHRDVGHAATLKMNVASESGRRLNAMPRRLRSEGIGTGRSKHEQIRLNSLLLTPRSDTATSVTGVIRDEGAHSTSPPFACKWLKI